MNRLAPSLLLLLALAWPSVATARPARERAIEQIPELMGRILETQEEIRAHETELAPRLAGYEQRLESARRAIEAADNENDAAAALTDYVEAYAQRLDEQYGGLQEIEGAIVRMRADARQLVDVAGALGEKERETPEARRAFFQDHFQGLASATGELARRLRREDEAATAGDVLHASWASFGSVDVSMDALGPEGALRFARKVEGLYARFQARSNQLGAERGAVRQLLDVLIERQLARRLDSLFEGSDSIGLGAILAGTRSDGLDDLGGLVRRTLGRPAGASPIPGATTASLGRLEHFAHGDHRD